MFANFFWIPFAVVALVWGRAMLKRGGWRGAMLGGAIRDTVAEQELENRVMLTGTTLRVHVLEPGEDPSSPSVGVEVVRRAPLSWSTSGFSLTREEALALSEHLSVAAREAPRELHKGV